MGAFAFFAAFSLILLERLGNQGGLCTENAFSKGSDNGFKAMPLETENGKHAPTIEDIIRKDIEKKLQELGVDFDDETVNHLVEMRNSVNRPDIAEMLSDWTDIKETDPHNAELLPPWLQHPNIQRESIGWRMGYGEDYFVAFRSWYLNLGSQERQAFKYRYAEPADWQGFYVDLEKNQE